MDIQQKSQRFSFFLDISGSVGGSDNYWGTVNDILTMYGPDIESFYFWDTQVILGTKKQLEEMILKKTGRGGTAPYVVANECIKKQLRNIILITDGEVGQDQVKLCNGILAQHKFNKSICYIISSSSWGNENLNMSVTCAFTRNCDMKVFKKLPNSPIEAALQCSKQDLKLVTTLDTITLQNFEKDYEKLENLIIALNMGKDGNIPLKNDLLVMKKRLIHQLTKKSAKKDMNVVIRGFLEKGEFAPAMAEMQIACKAYLEDKTGVELQRKITHLISLCGDLSSNFDLGQIKSNKMAIALDATKGQIDQNAQIDTISKNLIECPILFQDDVPQILIDQCQPLLKDVQKSIVDDVVACPLRILNYPQLKQKLKSRLSNYVGVMGIKAHFNKDLLKNPFTQNRLLGSIPLGSDKSHVKVGNYTIAKLIAGGKIMGNVNLYYAVIWYLIQEKTIQYLKDIETNATEHLLYRMKTSQTYASLCGKAQFVNSKVSTDIAVWYCVNSGFLNLPQNQDTFRFHFYDLEPLMKIVAALGYPNDSGLMEHYNRTGALLGFLSVYKTMKSRHDKKTLQNLLTGLYQNGVFINPKQLTKEFIKVETCSTFVPVDGPASEQQIEKIRLLLAEKYKFTKLLTNSELYHIAKLADPNKNISNYFLDYNSVIPPLPQYETNWKQYGMEDFTHPKINPKTLRPIYEQKNENEQKDSPKLKEYKYFQAFVFKYQKQPTVDELLLFYYNRYVEAGKIHTLPCMVEKWAQQLVEEYKPHFEALNVKHVKRVFNKYRAVEKRIKIENEN